MYHRILLAYDGSMEGRRALREGALLARTCRAKVFLLSVVATSAGMQIGESALAGAVVHEQETYRLLFDEGVERLRALGFEPVSRLVQGEAAQEIAAFAREVSADLVVVGHRRQGLLARWWSGSTGASLLNQVGCSLLIAHKDFTDEAFAAALASAS